MDNTYLYASSKTNCMNNRNIILFFAYLFGIVALVAVLTNDKKDERYTFHAWQALLFQCSIAIVFVALALGLPFALVIFGEWAVFLTILPFILIPPTLLCALILAILAAIGSDFHLPIITSIAEKR
jgi:uncharacterized membrane protein